MTEQEQQDKIEAAFDHLTKVDLINIIMATLDSATAFERCLEIWEEPYADKKAVESAMGEDWEEYNSLRTTAGIAGVAAMQMLHGGSFGVAEQLFAPPTKH